MMNMYSSIKLQYYDLHRKLSKILEYVNDKLLMLPELDFTFELNLKPIDSVFRKCKQRGIDNIIKLSDLVRGRTFFSKNYSHDITIKLLKIIFPFNIKNIEWKNDKENGLIYTGVIHVDMIIDNINFELQIMPEEFKPYKEHLHHIYEMIRNKINLPDDISNKLKNIHNEVYKILTENSIINRVDDI